MITRNLAVGTGTLVHTVQRISQRGKLLRTVTPNHHLAEGQDDQWQLLALVVKGQRPMALAASPSLPSLSALPELPMFTIEGCSLAPAAAPVEQHAGRGQREVTRRLQ
jgi:hypothetical protein